MITFMDHSVLYWAILGKFKIIINYFSKFSTDTLFEKLLSIKNSLIPATKVKEFRMMIS